MKYLLAFVIAISTFQSIFAQFDKKNAIAVQRYIKNLIFGLATGKSLIQMGKKLEKTGSFPYRIAV